LRKKIFTIILIVLSYNLIFFLQSYFKSELQIYFLGFRLNLFLFVNSIVILIHKSKLGNFKFYLKNLGSIKNWIVSFALPFVITFISLIIFSTLGNLKYNKPDYLIEFGLTSITDLPIYYLWNLPFLASCILVWLFLLDNITFLRNLFFSFLFTLAFIVLNFDLSHLKLDPSKLSGLVLIFGFIFYNSGLLKSFKSVWISILSILISIYSYVLVFGSKNSFLIKLFFARNYDEWEGIFTIKKVSNEMVDLIFASLMIFFAVFFFIFDKRKSKKQ